MDWPVLLATVALLMAYSFVRHQARRWIVDRWLADRLSNRQVAALLVMTYAIPLIALAVWIGVTTPGSGLLFIFTTGLFGVVLIAGVAGRPEYASVYGVKQRMLKDRGS